MEQNAEVAPEVELTPENWINLIGEDGTVDTPIGSVKMGENQYFKLFKKNRAQYLGMIKPTLSNPDIVLEEYDPKDNAERESKYLFVKTFIKADGSRYVHFESVTVKKDNLEVAISSHEVNESALTKKVQQSKLLHLNSKFLNSDGRLIEPLNEGSDLVPTPNSVSDSNKSVSTDKDSERRENNNILDENVLSTLKEDIENLRAKADTIEYELDYLADNINNQLGYNFRDGIDLYKRTFIKLGSNKLKTLKWFRDNVSDNKDYPNLIFDFAKTLNQIYILESQLERADEQFDEHIATLPTGDAIQAITQRRGAEEADQYAQWRKGILTKERDKAHKTLNAKHKPFDPSRYTDYAQMKREERKHNDAIQATRNEALGIINRTTAEIAHIDSYLANRNRQIVAEREAENPLRNGIAPAVAKLSINTLEQYIARYIALGGRLRMTDQYSNGLAAELGITPGSQEHRELLSILSNTEGMTPEQLAHDISENIEPEYRHLIAGRDVQDIRNAIIDTIASGVTSRRRAYQYIADANEKLSADEQRYIEEQELQAQIDADTEQAIRDYEELLLSSLSPDDLAIIDTMAGDYWDEISIQQYDQEAYNSLISPSAELGEDRGSGTAEGVVSNSQNIQTYDTNPTSTTPRITQQGAESTAIQSSTQPSNTTPIRQDSQDTATIRPETPQTSRNSSTRQDVVDNQGNPIDTDGNLIVETITSISEITDQDFETPTRSIVLPTLPDNVSNAIGTNGRAVIIKKNIFEKNGNTHVELGPSDSREILQSALYNTNIVGSTQPIKRPDYKVAIRTGEKNAVVVLDVFQGKEYVEIVGWRKVNEKGLEKMQRQAEREGGQFLILSPNDGSAAALSALPSGASSTGKANQSSSQSQKINEEITPEQSSLLGRPNFAQYPTEQELSESKDTSSSSQPQEINKQVAHVSPEQATPTLEQTSPTTEATPQATKPTYDISYHSHTATLHRVQYQIHMFGILEIIK